MSLFVRAGFEDFVSGLPAVTLMHQWGENSVAKVGGKVFAVMGPSGESFSVAFKVSDMAFDMLTEIDGIGQAPYFAKRHWVAVEAHAAIAEADVAAYIRESHRVVAGKLTRKLQAELGLTALAAAAPGR